MDSTLLPITNLNGTNLKCNLESNGCVKDNAKNESFEHGNVKAQASVELDEEIFCSWGEDERLNGE